MALPAVEQPTRSTWVDYAKGIGILLVVYGHVARGLVSAGIKLPADLYALVDSVIYTFHMPLFFFLSGLFFFDSMARRGRGPFILSKIDTIVYPYLLWSLIQGLIEVGMSRYTNGDANIKDVLSILWHPRAQFWFLYALFMVFVVATITYFNSTIELAMALFATGCALYIYQNELPASWNMGFIWRNYCFIALGALISKYIRHQEKMAPHVLLFSAIFIGIEYIFHAVLEKRFDQYGAWSLAVAISGIGFISAASIHLSKSNKATWLMHLGRASMAIYLMHTIASSGTRVILQKFGHIKDPWLHLCAGLMVGIVAPWIAYSLLTKWKFTGVFESPKFLSLSRISKNNKSISNI